MLTRRRSLPVVVVVVLAVAASVFVTTSSARRADAVCNGPGQPVTITRYDLTGTAQVSEGVPYPGTFCDNNSQYGGLLLDPITDGSCAYAYYLEPLLYLNAQGVSCTTGSWAGYTYTDVYPPNNVYVSIRPSYLSDDWRLSTGY
jgi:hypothetical protein